MDFFINKNSTLPILKLGLLNENYCKSGTFYEYLQNSEITFTMVNIENGVTKIAKAPATIFYNGENCVEEEYHIGYIFKARDTNTCGTYRGQFNITFNNGYGNLIVPIREELYIHVMEGTIKK